MKKYNRYVKLTCSLLGIFLLIFLCIHFLSKGFTNTYSIGNNKIKEIYTEDETDEIDNYYIEITNDKVKYNYQFYNIKKEKKKLIKKVLNYDGNYKCILPIFNIDLNVDFVCYKDGEYYNYTDIIGKDNKLDKYINDLSKKDYNVNTFKNNLNSKTINDKITFYQKNIPDKFILSLSTLKGITVVDDKINNYNIFDKDNYKRDLSIFYNNYYISANYDEKQNYSEIIVTNILNGKTKKASTPDMISFDSYFQGIVDDALYIYDRNSEVQYRLDIEKMKVKEVGNESKGIKYYDGKWSYISIIKANKTKLFNENSFIVDNYDYAIKKGNKLSGFIYLFKKDGKKYKVYKANVQNDSIKKYLFDITDYNDIIYLDDYIIYKDNGKIMMYSEYTGIKSLLECSELEFNDNIKFGIYVKDN
jgi:hypothetical protein